MTDKWQLVVKHVANSFLALHLILCFLLARFNDSFPGETSRVDKLSVCQKEVESHLQANTQPLTII